MKQSAVDWLLEQMSKEGMLPKLEDYHKAKQMEKQQIIDANYDGQRLHSKSCTKQMLQDNAESYFAETYGSNGSDEHIVDTNEMISSQTEISDEEIENEAYRYDENQAVSDWRNDSTYGDFIEGAKWYREQLKQRQ